MDALNVSVTHPANGDVRVVPVELLERYQKRGWEPTPEPVPADATDATDATGAPDAPAAAGSGTSPAPAPPAPKEPVTAPKPIADPAPKS